MGGILFSRRPSFRLSVCPSVRLYVCPEQISETAEPIQMIFGVVIYNHEWKIFVVLVFAFEVKVKGHIRVLETLFWPVSRSQMDWLE